MSLLAELQRRNVFRVATFYVVAGWVLLQAGDLLFDALGVPPWASSCCWAAVARFPFALFFAWAYRAHARRAEARTRGRARRVDHRADRHETQHPDRRTAGPRDRSRRGQLVRPPQRCGQRPMWTSPTSAGAATAGTPADQRVEARIAAAQAFDCGAAIREHERRKGQRVFFGRPDRRTPERARERSGPARDRPHVVVRVQGQGRKDCRRGATNCRWITCSRAAYASPATRCASPHSSSAHPTARTSGRKPMTAASTIFSRCRTRSPGRSSMR